MKASRLTPYFVFLSMWLFLLGCDTASSIESPSKNYFLKYYGNDGDQTGVDLVVNGDGSMVLFGTSKIKTNQPSDNTQFFVVKASPLGDTLWTRTFGGAFDEEARDIELTTDGRIIVVGNSYTSVGGPRNILMIILDQNGNKLDELLQAYSKESGAPGDLNASSVTETNDGFIVAGTTSNLHDLSSLTIQNEALYARFKDKPLGLYGAPWEDRPSTGQGTESAATKIVQLPNQDFYVFGYSKYSQSGGGPKGDFDYWYFGLSSNGTSVSQVWTFGSPTTDEKLESVAVVPNQGGFFLNGITTNLAGIESPFIAKLRGYPLGFSDTTDFEIAPIPLVGVNLGAPTDPHTGVGVAAGTGYLAVYTEASNPVNSNILLTKISLDGQQPWQTIYGGQGDDVAGSVQELPDGKIVMVGTMSIGQLPGETKMLLIKVNKDGQFAD